MPKLKQTVVRAGFGMNYTVGSYATFATTMAHQPPFANEQTNQEITAQGAPTSACVQTGTCFTLGNGFPAPATVGNYALDPHFQLPYVQTWNLDIQKTLPWGIVMNRWLQRIEGQSSGYCDRAASARHQSRNRSDRT